eukprot:2265931-Rhodomonas_salina.1
MPCKNGGGKKKKKKEERQLTSAVRPQQALRELRLCEAVCTAPRAGPGAKERGASSHGRPPALLPAQLQPGQLPSFMAALSASVYGGRNSMHLWRLSEHPFVEAELLFAEVVLSFALFSRRAAVSCASVFADNIPTCNVQCIQRGLLGEEVASPLWPYTFTVRCPYAFATRCPVLTSGMRLPGTRWRVDGCRACAGPDHGREWGGRGDNVAVRTGRDRQ